MARRKSNKAIEAAPEVIEQLPGEDVIPAELTTEQPAPEPTYDELKAKVAELESQLAEKQTHILWTSKVQKPVALVREIFCRMYGSQRKDVIAACINAGIAANTAKTQYQILKGKAERGELEELLDEAGESEE
jgi:hypothetical protein